MLTTEAQRSQSFTRLCDLCASVVNENEYAAMPPENPA
jgi:hypothetical protein